MQDSDDPPHQTAQHDEEADRPPAVDSVHFYLPKTGGEDDAPGRIALTFARPLHPDEAVPYQHRMCGGQLGAVTEGQASLPGSCRH